MKNLIKRITSGVALAIIGVVLIGGGVVYAVNFPNSLNNFSAGDSITADDWNALEAEIGIHSNSADATSLNGRLLNGMFSATGTLAVGGSSTTTVSGVATSTFSKGINLSTGCFAIRGTCILNAAITSLNGLVGAVQTFVNDTNVTITSSGTTHTLGWSGNLSAARGGLGGDFSASTGSLFFTGGTAAATTSLSRNYIDDAYLRNNGDVGTGVYDFGGATSLEVPNGTSVTLSAAGQLGIDTTVGQFEFYDGANTHIITGTSTRSFWVGSTTPDKSFNQFGNSATTTFELINDPEPLTLRGFYCKTDTGTVRVRVGDGTNWTTDGSCTSSGTWVETASNNTFTAFEDIQYQIGTSASSPNKVTITSKFNLTAQ